MDGRWQVAAQVALALLVVALLYGAVLCVLNLSGLVPAPASTPVARQEVVVVDGWVTGGIGADRAWNTVAPASPAYAPLRPSYNRSGGAQFSYSFWMRLEADADPAAYAGRDILLRGDPTHYEYQRTVLPPPGLGPSAAAGAPETRTGPLAKCPRVRFGDGLGELVVEFNTLTDPDEALAVEPTPGDDDTVRRNLLRMVAGRWTLYTVSFEDAVSSSTGFESGVRVRLYVNDTLYATHWARGALRQNPGDLVLLPTPPGGAPLDKMRVGDLRYFNYAVPDDVVADLFRRGPPGRMSAAFDSGAGEPLFMSEYNRLDIYNNM